MKIQWKWIDGKKYKPCWPNIIILGGAFVTVYLLQHFGVIG